MKVRSVSHPAVIMATNVSFNCWFLGIEIHKEGNTTVNQSANWPWSNICEYTESQTLCIMTMSHCYLSLFPTINHDIGGRVVISNSELTFSCLAAWCKQTHKKYQKMLHGFKKVQLLLKGDDPGLLLIIIHYQRTEPITATYSERLKWMETVATINHEAWLSMSNNNS